MFGRTSDGKSVYLKVIDFPPHFYILLPETWREDKSKEMIDNLIWKLLECHAISCYLHEKLHPPSVKNI